MQQNEGVCGFNSLTFIKGARWNPERTGDYMTDCVTGREYADEMLRFITMSDNPTIYSSVVRAMTEAGEFGAVEIGFSAQIGILLMAKPA